MYSRTTLSEGKPASAHSWVCGMQGLFPNTCK
nr:MAG TPA: hypothetical protein [Caudoviricetes sp.]